MVFRALLPSTHRPPTPAEAERARLAALRRYDVLDSPPEDDFDRLTRLAALIYDVPIALISFVDEERQWFKSRLGLDACETPRSASFCQHAIRGETTLIIEDAPAHPLVCQSPLVTGPPHLRFYAGAPLITPDGHKLGTLCILDTVPRPGFAPRACQALEALAAIGVNELELRLASRKYEVEMHRAEAANEAKSRFLATMSHEIRTPMNGVMGMAELLSETELTALQRHYVDVIKSSGETLLHIINDVLDVSKIEVGKLELESIAFDVRETVESVIALLEPRAKAKNLVLEGLVGASVPRRLEGDPARIRQILLNLLGNALKFTERGAVRLIVRLATNPAERCILRFEVSDTGIGIAPDVIPRLFDRFIQADSSTSRRYGGTGLGLAITKQLVELMGGTISVRSTPGDGTTFSFTLALQQARDAGQAAAGLAKKAAFERPLSVLLAEDHAVNQMVCRTILEQAGARVTLASTGLEAVAHAREASFDAVLMDVHMPEMDGIEATQQIRKLMEGRAPVPIIGLTADVMGANARACWEAGMNEVLGKPYRPAELLEVIARLTRR